MKPRGTSTQRFWRNQHRSETADTKCSKYRHLTVQTEQRSDIITQDETAKWLDLKKRHEQFSMSSLIGVNNHEKLQTDLNEGGGIYCVCFNTMDDETRYHGWT